MAETSLHHFPIVLKLQPTSLPITLPMEKDLAEDLRRTGYAVTGGH